jgi:hypothetical protein
MRIFKNKDFHLWAEKQNLKDEALVKVVKEMEQGLYEANLGSYVYKKRVPLGSKGKSGGFRVIFAFKAHQTTVFMYGFSKKNKENITDKEKASLKALSKKYLTLREEQWDKAVQSGKFTEVSYEKIYS